MEYNSNHDIEIPRAPAFTCKRPSEVKQIVSRLMMKPKERFNFVHTPSKNVYNDWKSAHEDKVQRLRNTVHMFGGANRHYGKSKEDGEHAEENSPQSKSNGRKKRKRSKLETLSDFSHVAKFPEISEAGNVD